MTEYGLYGREVIRPFYPGGDYESHPYPTGCVVIDNPPFSILSRIVDHYNRIGVDYFLFAPALTLLSTSGNRCNAVISNSSITYENGAVVRTGFVTNMGAWKVHVAADLYAAIDAAQRKATESKTELPKYVYPDEVLTAATIQKITKYGVSLKIAPEDCAFVRSIDSQKATGKALFGGGMLLSKKAAAEKAAAEKAAAEKAGCTIWTLSDRENAIISALGTSKD